MEAETAFGFMGINTKLKKAMIKKTPALALVANGMNAAMLNDLVKMCGQIKTGKGLFGKYKKYSKQLGDLYLIAALTKDSKGRIGFRSTAQMVKQYEKLTGHHVSKAAVKLLNHIDDKIVFKALTKGFGKSVASKRNLRVFINAKGDIVANAKGVANRFHLLDAHKWINPNYKDGLSFGTHLKSALGAAKDAISPFKLIKDFREAEGVGKVVPGLNIAFSAAGAVDGVNDSEKLANQAHLKGNKKVASVAGGAGIDVGTTAAIAGASDLAASTVGELTLGALAGTSIVATAPAWVTGAVIAALGAAAAFGVSELTNKWGLNTKLKKAFNNSLANN